MKRKIEDGYIMPIVFKTMIEQGDEGFKSIFELGTEQALENFNKGIEKYKIGHFGFTVSKSLNEEFILNVEINEQDISNIDIKSIFGYLKEYKSQNKTNFERINIHFKYPIINQKIFDLINLESKKKQTVRLGDKDVVFAFSKCNLKNVDLTNYTIEQLNEMNILSDAARFNGCKINIEIFESLLKNKFYSKQVGDLSNFDISKINITKIEELFNNFKYIRYIIINLDGVKLSKEQVEKILITDGFLGRKKGDLHGFNLSGLDLRMLDLKRILI